jgi:hypothetical protein
MIGVRSITLDGGRAVHDESVLRSLDPTAGSGHRERLRRTFASGPVDLLA